MLCKIDNYLRILYRLSGYIASVFLVLVAAFILTGIASRIFGFYIRGLAEYSANQNIKRFLEIWCLSVATFFSGFLAFYFIKMLIISIQFGERSEGADEIYIWIPQVTVALGSTIFFICVMHNLILMILKKNNI